MEKQKAKRIIIPYGVKQTLISEFGFVQPTIDRWLKDGSVRCGNEDTKYKVRRRAIELGGAVVI